MRAELIGDLQGRLALLPTRHTSLSRPKAYRRSDLHVSSAEKQILGSLDVVIDGSDHEGGLPVVRSSVDISSGIEDLLHRLEVLAEGRRGDVLLLGLLHQTEHVHDGEVLTPEELVLEVLPIPTEEGSFPSGLLVFGEIKNGGKYNGTITPLAVLTPLPLQLPRIVETREVLLNQKYSLGLRLPFPCSSFHGYVEGSAVSPRRRGLSELPRSPSAALLADPLESGGGV